MYSHIADCSEGRSRGHDDESEREDEAENKEVETVTSVRESGGVPVRRTTEILIILLHRVKNFSVVHLIGLFRGVAPPALLCHNEPARSIIKPPTHAKRPKKLLAGS